MSVSHNGAGPTSAGYLSPLRQDRVNAALAEFDAAVPPGRLTSELITQFARLLECNEPLATPRVIVGVVVTLRNRLGVDTPEDEIAAMTTAIMRRLKARGTWPWTQWQEPADKKNQPKRRKHQKARGK